MAKVCMRAIVNRYGSGHATPTDSSAVLHGDDGQTINLLPLSASKHVILKTACDLIEGNRANVQAL